MVEVWDRSIEVSDAEENSEQKKRGILYIDQLLLTGVVLYVKFAHTSHTLLQHTHHSNTHTQLIATKVRTCMGV